MKDIKVLVVDDVESNRVSLQYLINEYLEQVDLVLASNGEDALKITYKDDIDIIILDIQMPGLDGFDTARYLKSNPKTQNIPIIFLTAAFKEEEFKQKGFEIGAIDYLTKPIENIQFINKLKLYIEIIMKNKQLQAVNDNLYEALQKEIQLKEKIQSQQLELVEQSKMAALGEMIGNIAHQWRQPLSVISTSASGVQLNIELGLSTPEETINNLQTILKTTEELSTTIESFRDFNNTDNLEEFNLNEVIEKCIENQNYILEQNSITVVKSFDEEIKLTNLANSLTQALVNIIHNAKEALEKTKTEKKFIFVTTKVEEKYITIKVKDNAGGIKTDHLNKIFEPYFTTKHQSHGIGLGLNIVYRIIKDSMCGKIKVRNSKFVYEDINCEGAEFIITLPKKI